MVETLQITNPISKAEQALMYATTPQQSKEVEALAKVAKAWAKELDYFEGVVMAARLYILARRKTTELSKPFAPEWGGDRGENQYAKWQDFNTEILPSDFDFTPLQWHRRNKELEITLDDIENYIDFCIETHIEPTVFGLLKYTIQIIGDPTGNEWWTPAIYIKSVRNVLGEIDLDPASCEEANTIVQAKQIYTEEDSGLAHSWYGRVFMNPPYSANQDFAEKMREEYAIGNVTEAIVLLGAHAIETKWFASYWDHVLCFTGHRIKFDTPTGPAIAGNIAGSVFVHLSLDSHKFADEFNQHGYIVKRWP
jgi:phage N-6-adenine-methyltransferase